MGRIEKEPRLVMSIIVAVFVISLQTIQALWQDSIINPWTLSVAGWLCFVISAIELILTKEKLDE